MTDMVERVARAIACSGKMPCREKPDEGRMPCTDDPGYCDCWQDARAAIAAMREPSTKMVSKGNAAHDAATRGKAANRPKIARIYQAMIDEALKDA